MCTTANGSLTVDSSIMNLEFCLSQLVFESTVGLSSLHDVVTATWGTFGDMHPDTSPGGIVVLIPAVAGDENGE